jgi:hypothetical protein
VGGGEGAACGWGAGETVTIVLKRARSAILRSRLSWNSPWTQSSTIGMLHLRAGCHFRALTSWSSMSESVSCEGCAPRPAQRL